MECSHGIMTIARAELLFAKRAGCSIDLRLQSVVMKANSP
jgi:hypothetical protein